MNRMILFKILLLFLFCDNFSRITAQLNKCITPEGNEGFCMNIWECKSRTKYIFSETQNSVETFNTLKSVCDYTNSTIKLCCNLSSNTGNSSILQELKNIEYVKVCDNNSNQNENSDVYKNKKRIKRQEFILFKTNTNRNDENNNNNNNNEEPIKKAANLKDYLKLNKIETNTETIILNDYKYVETLTEVIPIFTQINENSVTDVKMNESTELTEPPDINCETNIIEISDNKENLINDTNSELLGTANENNQVIEPKYRNIENIPNMRNIENKKSINKIGDYDQNSELTDIAKKNMPVEFKISTNSGNQINNNTFIIINMRDRSTIFNNNNSSNVPFIQADKNGNMINSQANDSDKISMDLFKKILCVIFGKNYNLAAFSQDNSDTSLVNNVNIYDTNIDTEDIPTELASEITAVSSENSSSIESSSSENIIENTYSPESNSYENQVASTSSSENSILQESIENMNSSESENSPPQIENTLENGTDFSFLGSDESEEVFDYIALPNPPQCGRNKKYTSKKGEYSWQVLLKEKDKKSTKDFCRGTLITRQHIVTTAYCIKNREIESVLIRSEKMSAYITLKIKDIKVHEHFEPNLIQNDIALIKLFAPITLEEISPICLKVDSNLTKNLTGIIAFSSGYLKNSNESNPKALKIISQYECINELNDFENFFDVDENVLCAKSKAGTEDICLGNEGSPLMIRGRSNGQIIYYQIGIVSEVNHCDTNRHLSLFLSMNLYLNWILKNM